MEAGGGAQKEENTSIGSSNRCLVLKHHHGSALPCTCHLEGKNISRLTQLSRRVAKFRLLFQRFQILWKSQLDDSRNQEGISRKSGSSNHRFSGKPGNFGKVTGIFQTMPAHHQPTTVPGLPLSINFSVQTANLISHLLCKTLDFVKVCFLSSWLCCVLYAVQLSLPVELPVEAIVYLFLKMSVERRNSVFFWILHSSQMVGPEDISMSMCTFGHNLSPLNGSIHFSSNAIISSYIHFCSYK